MSGTNQPETLRDEASLLRRAAELLAALPPSAKALADVPALEGPLFETLVGDEAFAPAAVEGIITSGLMVGSVRLEHLLGQGGMGTVWRGFDTRLGRPVAAKFLRPGTRLGTAARSRFLREARLLSRLNHPSICQVYDLVEFGSDDCLLLELVEGHTLEQWSRTNPTVEAKLGVAISVAEALAVAHQRGVVHRDLKPDNVMVTEAGMAKVLDFGIARSLDATLEETAEPDAEVAQPDRLTLTRGVLGTPAFMSPEQARGEPVGVATDIYSFGLLLQALFCSQPGHSPESGALLVLDRVAGGISAPATGADPEICVLIEAMKALDPTSRPAASEVASRLRWLASRPQRRRRRMVLGAMVGVVVAALATAGAVMIHARIDAQRRLATAQRAGAEVASIEAALRTAALLPLHDLRDERRNVSDQLEQLESQLEAFSDAGPVHYAIGRGRLGLGQLEAAREHLRRSWDLGFQEPEVAQALGMTLGELYQAALVDANRGTKSSRTAAIARAETELRDPAIGWLALVATDTKDGQSLLVQASLAFYQQEWDTALDRAEQAFTMAPGAYEARRLQGAIELARGGAEVLAGANESADRTFAAADHYFDQAITIARSDLGSLTGRCKVGKARMALAYETGRDPEEHYLATRKRCGDALLAGPDDSELLEEVSNVYYLRSWTLEDTTADPVAPARLAVDFGRRALAADPRRAQAHNALGTALRQLADVLSARGEDVLAELEEAAERLRAAIALEPTRAAAHFSLASLLWNLAYADYLVGVDPTARFEEAIRSFEASIEFSPPSAASGLTMIGAAAGMTGLYQLERGRAPQQWLRRSIEAFEQSIASQPGNPWPVGNIAMAYRDLARWSVRTGEPPDGLVSRGLDYIQQARAIKANYGEVFLTEAELHLERAKYHHSQGESALEALDLARSSLLHALELNPNNAGAQARMGETWLLEANWLRAAPREASVRLERALALLERAGDSAEAQASLAEARYLAALLATSTAARSKSVRLGLAAIDKAIATNSTLGTSHLTKARLLAEATTLNLDVASQEVVRAALAQAEGHDPLLAPAVHDLRQSLEPAI